MRDRFTIYLGLAFIVCGQGGQILHHYRVAFVADSSGETFGTILIIGVLIQLVALSIDA